jgi:DNA-binding NarL/FixJ family response regulator
MIISNNTIDIAILDDDISLIKDLDTLFKSYEEINLRWAGEDIQHFLDNAAHKTDVLLLDIDLGQLSGIDLIQRVKDKNPRIQVIMFTVLEDNNMLLECMKSGADGYLLKDTTLEFLISSIKDTFNGGSNMSPLMARKLFNYFTEKKENKSKWADLTDVEYQVLKLLSDGYSYKIIGDKLDASLDSVRYYIKALYRKLHVNSKGEAIKIFLTS